MTITPDMPILNMDAVSPFNEAENYNEEPHTSSDPPLFTPETGIHFLFAPSDTVDLTTAESSKKLDYIINFHNSENETYQIKYMLQKTNTKTKK